MDDETQDRLRGELEEERSTHVEFLDEHGADPYSDAVGALDVDDGFADSAQATEQRSEILGRIDTSRSRVRSIDEALARMDEGKYGICEVCGDEIDPGRLEIRPLSVRCVEHADA